MYRKTNVSTGKLGVWGMAHHDCSSKIPRHLPPSKDDRELYSDTKFITSSPICTLYDLEVVLGKLEEQSTISLIKFPLWLHH